MWLELKAKYLARSNIVAFAFAFSLFSPIMYGQALCQDMNEIGNTSALIAQDNNSQSDQPTTNDNKETNVKESTETHKLSEVDVEEVGRKLNQAREQIAPSLGATSYQISNQHIKDQSQGENASFNQTLLRLPSVVQDSFGQLHVRGEHANLQYRIDDILIPEGIAGFGQEFSTRYIDHMSLIMGALPAQFGFRTAGIVDIHTKSGIDLHGGDLSFYGGSFETINPSAEYGGTKGPYSYYLIGSYLHNNIGIENPTSSYEPIHDRTNQFKGFADISYFIDDTSRLNLIISGVQSYFQIPNNPGQTPAFTLEGVPTFNSADLNENQTETNDFILLSYQKVSEKLNYQVSAFSRFSRTQFDPDQSGDLIFNGVASQVDRSIFSNGIEVDASYALNKKNTIRGGLLFNAENLTENTSNLVFPTDSMGNQASSVPFGVVDNNSKLGLFYGVYLQDEWKVLDKLTVNFGARFDVVHAFTNEHQLSPRINLVYDITHSTIFHTGYARYFTPPPMEIVNDTSIEKFSGTTNAPEVTENSPVRAERANYFDAGITQQVLPGLELSMDGYYKTAKQQLDEGQFGTALIFSAFNYENGKIYGLEFTGNYQWKGLSAYGNFAYANAQGKNIDSAQFTFGQDELNYIQNHWIYLDHDQKWTGSGGLAYVLGATRFYTDLLYGSGLRSGFANTESIPQYCTVNAGIVHNFTISPHRSIQARFDIVNLYDKVYEIRSGTGVGVGAPQYGQPFGVYVGIAYKF